MPDTHSSLQDFVFIHEHAAYRNPVIPKYPENLAYAGLDRWDSFLNVPVAKTLAEANVPTTVLGMEQLAEGLLAGRQTQRDK